MPEPEAELQATANLSPVSPSPVHTASPLVVPALQDTVDTIDAMVAAVVASASQPGDEAAPTHGAVDSIDAGDIVDDDPYGDDTQSEAVAGPPQAEMPSSNDDDYAKTFDSPIASDHDEEGHHPDAQPGSHSSSSRPLSNHPSVASHSVLDPLLAQASATDHATARPRSGDSLAASSSHRPQDHPQAGQQAVPSYAQEGSQNGASTAEPAIDLQRLVANLTAHSNEPTSRTTPEPNNVQASKGAGPTSSSSGLPSASSLPPRPPLPNTASHSYVSQHHPGGSNLGLATGNAASPAISGQPVQMLAAGAPGTMGAMGSLVPPSASGLTSAVNPALSAPDYASGAPGYANDRKGDGHRNTWEQFVADERQYMSEAKWDRFPEGSRIFIGTQALLMMFCVTQTDTNTVLWQETSPVTKFRSVTFLTYSTRSADWHKFLSNRPMALFNITPSMRAVEPLRQWRVLKSRGDASVSLAGKSDALKSGLGNF